MKIIIFLAAITVALFLIGCSAAPTSDRYERESEVSPSACTFEVGDLVQIRGTNRYGIVLYSSRYFPEIRGCGSKVLVMRPNKDTVIVLSHSILIPATGPIG